MGPCLTSPQSLYVEGISGTPERITGAEGDWSGSENGRAILTVESTNRWEVGFGAGVGQLVTPGMTYTGAGILPNAPAYFSLIANGVQCASPDSTFTVYVDRKSKRG